MNERIYYSRDAEQRAQQQRVIIALAMITIGVGIGTVLAMLFAPRAGEETRKVLANQVGHAYDEGREMTNGTLDNLRKEFDRLRSDVEDRLKQSAR